MPPPSKPPIPKAAQPVYHGAVYDPWTASSTGHQRAENRLGASTGWRESRNRKLMSQFTGGPGGGKRVADTVGAGSQNWDPATKTLITHDRAEKSVLEMLLRPGSMRPAKTKTNNGSGSGSGSGSASCASPQPQPRSMPTPASVSASAVGAPREPPLGKSVIGGGMGKGKGMTGEERLMLKRKAEDEARAEAKKVRRGIFDGVVVYVNGSTYPLISDHMLKHVLAEHGGTMSYHLGRRRVTHVILGPPAAPGHGCGGGLAGRKLQSEIVKIGGAAVKYVSVEWVLESIKAGIRLPEAQFVDLKIAPNAQNSVYGLYAKKGKKPSAEIDKFQPPPSAQARSE